MENILLLKLTSYPKLSSLTCLEGRMTKASLLHAFPGVSQTWYVPKFLVRQIPRWLQAFLLVLLKVGVSPILWLSCTLPGCSAKDLWNRSCCGVIWPLLLCVPGFICEMKLNGLSRTNQIHTCLWGVYRMMKWPKETISEPPSDPLVGRCAFLVFAATLSIYFGRSQRWFGYAPEVVDQWLKVSIWLFSSNL